MSTPPSNQRRLVILAGHRGDVPSCRQALADDDPAVREAALGALVRCEALTDDELASAATDASPIVRRRVAEVAGPRAALDQSVLLGLLGDADATVVEVAAWACGEQEHVTDDVLDALIALAGSHADPLVRESAVAALGAIGDERGVPAILTACSDKPAVRRRAVLALAPFEGPEVVAALQRALTDRDWQVRQGAEDLLDPHR